MKNYNVTSPVPQPYEFEKSIDIEEKLKWLDNNWHVSIYWSVAYVASIFCLQKYMKNREPFELRGPLIAWNMLLAIFSIIGTLRMLPGFLHVLKEFGMAFSVCDNEYGFRLTASLFWGWLFLNSKILELGDTMFIILRKRKLVFLHWYHHIVTLVMVWHVSTYRVAMSHWTGLMNFAVHSFMYSYFALRAMDIKLPLFVAMLITTLQIGQMVINLLLLGYIFYLQSTGNECYFPSILYNYGLCVFGSYALLFCNYFYKAYICGRRHKHLKNM